jgi:hypothetical protein
LIEHAHLIDNVGFYPIYIGYSGNIFSPAYTGYSAIPSGVHEILKGIKSFTVHILMHY